MFKQLYLGFLGCCCLLGGIKSPLMGQSRSDLEKQRTSVNRQIKSTSSQLSKTKQSRKNTLAKIALLKQEILSGQKTIESLRAQKDSFDTSIDRKMVVVEQLEIDQQKLRKNYKILLRNLYKLQLCKKEASPLFSSSSFNKRFQNWIYYLHLSKTRTVQSNYISKTQQALVGSINKLESTKAEQQELVQMAQQQYDLIRTKIRDADKKASVLSKKERQLRSDLVRKKRYKKQMSKKIEKIIHQQIAEAKRKARAYKKKKAAEREASIAAKESKEGPKIRYVPSLKNLDNAFSTQRGKLMSPVYQVQIVGFYGKNKHPSLKDVYIYNNGIDIKGQYNSVILNVFQGTVVSIFSMPGQNNAVMINHGDYYTTYTNIAKVYVKKGQKIRTGGQLGTIGRGLNGAGYIMHFEIWKNKNKDNPKLWLKK